MNSRYLILKDGTYYKGKSFGSNALQYKQILETVDLSFVVAELVFNTSMCSYTEVLTDNSYAGQMVVMTSPHIGTVGCDPSWFQHLTDNPQIRGIIAKKVYDGYLLHDRLTFNQTCIDFSIPGIQDIDTRHLTIHLRENGSMYGILVDEESLDEQQIQDIVHSLQLIPSMESFDFITPSLHSTHIETMGDKNSHLHVALIDYGTKKGIVDELLQRGVKVSIIPALTFLFLHKEDLLSYDILFFSNGPGDPRSLTEHVKKIQSFLSIIPIRGICLGHQLISLALGNTIEKLTYGHHGSNHPVLNEIDTSILITSQNHNYSVVREGVVPTSSIWFTNLNDRSVEGIIDNRHNVLSTQFHPEGKGGSLDAISLFDTFLKKEGVTCQK